MSRYANRGAYFEEWVEQANDYYNQRNMAVINKIPTPWKVSRKYNPYTKQYAISAAFPEKKSTVDFGGTASNQSIWFDVKTTQNKTSFPLTNIYGHQKDYLRKVAEQGGKAFILIHASVLNKTWLLWIDQLAQFIQANTRKSLSFEWLNENCEEVKSSTGIIVDYLPLVLRRNEDNHDVTRENGT